MEKAKDFINFGIVLDSNKVLMIGKKVKEKGKNGSSVFKNRELRLFKLFYELFELFNYVFITFGLNNLPRFSVLGINVY